MTQYQQTHFIPNWHTDFPLIAASHHEPQEVTYNIIDHIKSSFQSYKTDVLKPAALVKVVGGGDGRGWWRRCQKKWSGLGWGWSWWGRSEGGGGLGGGGPGGGGRGWWRSGWGGSGVGAVRVWGWSGWRRSQWGRSGWEQSRWVGAKISRIFFPFPTLFSIFLKLSGFFVDLCRWFGRFDFQKLCKTHIWSSLDIL